MDLPNFQRGLRASLLAALAFLVTGSLDAQRVTEGLQALYTFEDASGKVVRDRSGSGRPLNLMISDLKGVRRTAGALEVRGATQLRAGEPLERRAEAFKRSGEITVEAWITPANTKQAGPARILTISKNSTERNVTLGQEGDHYDLRLRTSRTSGNGLPSLPTRGRTVAPRLTHVVYTRDRKGRARFFLNGNPVAEKSVPGGLGNWDGSHRLALADEHGGGRLWLGTYHLVALYNRSLPAGEVGRNFKAGPGAGGGAAVVRGPSEKEIFFETKVAPLLADQCLECHDAGTRKGKLDLSRKGNAFAALKAGTPVVPGKPDESLLWESVLHDDMPEDREPLTSEQKAILKKWIADGATWSLERIDPADYVHGGTAEGTWVQRLTVPEYIATVRATVGVEIAKEARETLPRDLRADGFSNTAYNLSVDLKHVESYARLAEIIVSRMDVPKFADRFGRNRRFTDKEMGALIEKMGKWVLRGPLEKREVIGYRGITTAVAAAGGTTDEAIGLVVEAMLQSPRFLYRVEQQRGDGTPWPVDEYELATRMSFILWGASPDEELVRAAERGELSGREGLTRQIERMRKDSRAIERSLQFAAEWLNLGRLANMNPDRKKFPQWKPELGADMREETLAFFREVVWTQERPLTDLLNAQFTYLTPALAKHYGLQPSGQGVARYDLDKLPARGGLLTQGSVLTIGGDEASMVTRGLFVMHDLLRGVVKDPPPEVDVTPIPSKPGLTQRDAATMRIEDRSCGGCHSKFEPLAFGLEKFNGLGAYQEKDRFGNPLREDGEILIPGEAKAVPYATSAELMDLLAASDRVGQSITWKITQFALGRPLGASDARVVEKIHQEAKKNGGTYSDVVTAIILSDLVRMTRTETE